MIHSLESILQSYSFKKNLPGMFIHLPFLSKEATELFSRFTKNILFVNCDSFDFIVSRFHNRPTGSLGVITGRALLKQRRSSRWSSRGRQRFCFTHDFMECFVLNATTKNISINGCFSSIPFSFFIIALMSSRLRAWARSILQYSYKRSYVWRVRWAIFKHAE